MQITSIVECKKLFQVTSIQRNKKQTWKKWGLQRNYDQCYSSWNGQSIGLFRLKTLSSNGDQLYLELKEKKKTNKILRLHAYLE